MDLPSLIKRLTDFRREIHQHPETSFQEYNTRNRIKSILLEFSIPVESLFQLPPTALYVDLWGTAQPCNERRLVAFRADMDALNMTELNHHLSYRSKHEMKAHMCGHDGHVTCLVGFAARWMGERANIPSDRGVRLLFQPSEEGPESGAKRMIEQGCLQGVSQVYGFHQFPTEPIGQLWCKEGPVMSEITILKINIKGTGGHGSDPYDLKVAVWAAADFYQSMRAFIQNLRHQKPQKIYCTMPIFQAGERYNVISDRAHIEGTIRSFEEGLKDVIIQEIKRQLALLQQQGFVTEFYAKTNAPINSNTSKQAQNVLRVGRQVFGAQKVGPNKLPFKCSEDFAFFTKERPGAYFFFSSAKGPNAPMIHCAEFDFNDDLIEPASRYWVELAKDRLRF